MICDMPAPKGDPTYIKNKEKYFMNIAKSVAIASSHPIANGGCIVVRDREIIGDGRSILTDSKVEIDCVCYAIAAACKSGTPLIGSEIYTTRYPFSASIFQAHIMGVKRIYVQAHEWEPYYKDEFRRAARLARELSIAIEPLFDHEDPRLSVNSHAEREIDDKLYHEGTPDDYDPKDSNETKNDN